MADSKEPRFRIGYVLGKSFSVYLRNLIPFSLLSLVVMSPQLFVELQTVSADPWLAFDPGLLQALNVVLPMVLPYIATAMLVYGTVQELRGQRASIGDCIGRGIKMLFPVLGVVVAVSLAILVGLLFLVIPGLAVMTMFWVAIPAAVVERKGILDSLERSRELTDGRRWRVFAVIVLLFVLAVAGGFLISVGIASVLLLFGRTPTGMDEVVMGYFIAAVFNAVWAVAIGVGYFTLRVAKEGVDIEEIAKVFD